MVIKIFKQTCRRSVFLALFLLWSSSPCFAEVTAEAVRESLRRGIASLLEDQNVLRGDWPDYGGFTSGATSLCTLALLNAGVPADDPQIAAALNYLRKFGNPEKTYTTALQTMVFCTAEPERDRLLIRRNVAWLERAQVRTDRGKGGWAYDAKPNANPDNSNSQFAVLALNEAQRAGVTVDRRCWKLAQQYWEEQQLKDGSWGYRSPQGKGSMTCAGISSLIIANRNLTEGDAFVMGNRVVCCGMKNDDNAVQRGLGWMGRNFSVTHNPSSDANQHKTWLFYYLYGLERVGRLSGNRFLGDHDWYREGAEFLLEKQTITGAWQGTHYRGLDHITTAMAVLFLAKGQRPVVISKLMHQPADDWNRHRQDIGNLTRYIEQRWRRDLTWQIIDPTNATVEQLLQSPILFLSGRDGWRISKQQKQTLRDYINQGGFLFAETCCEGKQFDADFRGLMKELFPDNPLRLLPPDHPVWYAEQRVPAKYLRPLYGIDTCCRTSVVYCPENLGCYWELARGLGLQYPSAIQEEVDAMLAVGANVVAYATNRELRDKLDAPLVSVGQDDDSAFTRGTLRVAKLQHNGGSDDAPAALANLLRTAGTQLAIRVDTNRLIVPPTDPALPDYPVLFVHGRRSFSWTAEERAAVAEYVTNGGVIFGDAICAAEEFAKSLRAEMKSIFPSAEMVRIPADHPLFSDEFKGFDLSKVRLRMPRGRDRQSEMAAPISEVTPVLEGIELDGRFVVIFSPYDISCALESTASSDCEGYVSEDAARLGINILLYALQQ